MKILIGYDGSECSDRALNDLRYAGLPAEAEAVILSAVDVFIPPKNGESEEMFPNYVPQAVKMARKRANHAFEEAEHLAAKAAETVGKMFPEWKVSAEAQADTPHWAIIGKAEEWKPDLVVVGSHGRSALGRAFLGSVSQKVLYEAECSVRIARGRKVPSNHPVRLILGIDGSPDSEKMVDVVVSRNWQKDTQIKLITAIETLNQFELRLDVQLERVKELQASALEKLTKAGLEVTPTITDEDPKYFIVRQAAERQADCIFLGAKGHRFFERFFLGSVSSTVAARANCSVEVVRKSQ
jgi:nucleotide-binding universal stress UspA family protein